MFLNYFPETKRHGRPVYYPNFRFHCQPVCGHGDARRWPTYNDSYWRTFLPGTYSTSKTQAIVTLHPDRIVDLKRQLLLFDRVVNITPGDISEPRLGKLPSHLRAELDFLERHELFGDLDFYPMTSTMIYWDILAAYRLGTPLLSSAFSDLHSDSPAYNYYSDIWVRGAAAYAQKADDFESVPLCHDEPTSRLFGNEDSSVVPKFTDILKVSLMAFPAPADDCPWETILDFRQELAERKWGLRRFLKGLSSKRLTEAEIRDEIEWLINEYSHAMTLIKAKATYSTFETFLVSPLELIENVVKFNWSNIAKGLLSVKKRNIELLSAELTAPGRECAYVFEARQRFGT